MAHRRNRSVHGNRLFLSSVLLTAAWLLLSGRGNAEAVNLTRHGDTIAVEIGGKPFTTYVTVCSFTKEPTKKRMSQPSTTNMPLIRRKQRTYDPTTKTTTEGKQQWRIADVTF